MNINCKFCRAKLTVPDNVYGKLIRCSHCHKTFVVNVPRSDANAVIDETDRPPTDLASVPKAARFQHAMNPVAGKGTTPTEKPAYSSFREFLLPGLVSPFFSLVFAFAMTLLMNPPSTPSGVFLGVFLYVTLQPVFWMFFWGWLIFWLVSFHYAHGRCKGHLKSGDIRQATAIATRFRNGCWITYGVGLLVSIPIFLLYLPSFSPRIPSPIVVDEIETMEEGLYDENGLLLDEEEPPPPPDPDPDLIDSWQNIEDPVPAMRDASQKNREQNVAEVDIRAIFALAKMAENSGSVDFFGFYVGMNRTDADALVAHYGLKDGEWSFSGDPVVYSIHFSLKGVRQITKGGNSYEELCQAVANRVGSLQGKSNWKGDNREEWYEYKTIDGVRVTMAETRLPNANIDAAFNMVDTTGIVRKEFEREFERKAAAAWAKSIRSSPVARIAAESILAGMVQIPGKSYKMGKTEVTQAQWESIMRGNPSWFKGKDNPVERITWDDCQHFLSLLNSIPVVRDSGLTFRLPTDCEWEYACRAGSTWKYCRLVDGTEITESTLGEVAWFEDNSDRKTHPVGQKKPNAFGLYDMHGNVWEWTSTDRNMHGNAWEWTSTEKDKYRIYCGGCWKGPALNCSSSLKSWFESNYRDDRLGFRLCADSRAD